MPSRYAYPRWAIRAPVVETEPRPWYWMEVERVLWVAELALAELDGRWQDARAALEVLEMFEEVHP